jgi:ribA/ribD-fused uncharacterized protein
MDEWKMRETEHAVYFVSGPFSQWHPSQFEADLPALVIRDGKTTIEHGTARHAFSYAEQAMMASKAAVFGDEAVLGAILAATSPKKQKELGRSVANFDSATWSAVSYRIVAIMNYLKFSQNPDLSDILLATGDRHLVEGAWYDTIWGVGLGWDDPAIEDSNNWKGTNWLGEALMSVRTAIRDHGTDADPWQQERFRTTGSPPAAA